ncbi:MAG: sigma-54 dependent transcriptional regulator [Desulfovibrionaceae bacterium]|nr:sigma-54 dependent transcriptional regulator [Desulfovibrionaceae bacterium]
MTKLLVVDDEALVRALAQEAAAALGLETLGAGTLEEGLALGYEGVDLVLLDVLLPDGNGLERIKDFRRLPSRPEILIISGHGDGNAVETALRSGVYEFLSKPLNVQELTQAISQLMAYRLGKPRSQENASLARMGIIGNSPQLMATLQSLAEAAASQVNVLLLGETGVGKELFAHALHKNSPQAANSLVTVDCAALPANLVESHLFGHAKGAFTGADRSREGLLVAAHKGTLFLDEVGDLPAVIQGSFLRALELRRFRPVGAVREVESQFRLVAATNRDLEQLAALDLFRSDLLFRLRGISIHIPPLRDRSEDIPTLAQHAVMRFCAQHAIPVKEITDGCLNLLLSYVWPGNVRELIHTMTRACIAAGRQERIFPGHLPTELRVAVARRKIDNGTQASFQGQDFPSFADMPSLREWKTRAERMYVEQILKHCQGDPRKAADLAGLSRGHMYELLKKHGISRESPRPAAGFMP